MRLHKGLPNLSKARAVAKVTQKQLGDEIGITRAAVSRIEKGHNDPTLNTVLLIMHALAKRGLKVSVEYLADYPTGGFRDDYFKTCADQVLR